jgi:16S rRNA (guanine966-N2)-methyltransferase
MKQRVREAVFNLLGPRIQGRHVIDLFAGTGALAWEALSRGARSAVLVERHFPTARVIRQNAETLGLTDRITVVAGDTFVWARQLTSTQTSQWPPAPWVIFCAPPYELYVSAGPALEALLCQVIHLAPLQSVIVVEADAHYDLKLLPPQCEWDVRHYPPAVIAIGERSPRDEPSPSEATTS